MAVRTPMPPMKGTGIRKPKRARLGMVWARLARARTGRARRGRRARAMPRGTPIATAMPAETRTSRTCWPVRSSSSERRSARNLSRPTRDPSRPRRGDEVGHEPGLGRLPEQRGCAALQDAAAVHHRHLVAEPEGLRHVVGDEQDRLAQARLQAAELVLQQPPGEGIERAEGLVHQQQWRIGGEGAGDADPLALAARELGGAQGREAIGVEADEREQLPRPRDAPRRWPAHQLGHQAHVALHGEVGNEPHLLDDVAGAAAQLDGVPRLEPPPPDDDRAGVGLDQAVEGLERGRLARAAGAEQDQHAAVFHGEREAVEGRAPARIALVDVDELDGDGHGRPAATHSSASCLPFTRACSRFVSPPRKKVFSRRSRVTPSPSTWTLTLWVPAGTSSVADSLPRRLLKRSSFVFTRLSSGSSSTLWSSTQTCILPVRKGWSRVRLMWAGEGIGVGPAGGAMPAPAVPAAPGVEAGGRPEAMNRATAAESPRPA